MLLPKEHGAYAQLLFPLVTGLAVTGGATPAWWIALAATAAFLAHEPVLVLRGARGGRTRRAFQRQARWLLATATIGACGAGLMAFVSAPMTARLVLAAPLLSGVVFGVAVARDAEKSLVGELAATLTLATTPLPMCAASGLPLTSAAAVTLPFCVLFILTTGLVRAVVVGTRGGGDEADVRRTRVATLGLACLAAGMTVAGGVTGAWSWVVLAVEIPALAVGSLLAIAPPSATDLRRVGWTIVVVSTLTTALVIVAGRSGSFNPAPRLAASPSAHAR